MEFLSRFRLDFSVCVSLSRLVQSPEVLSLEMAIEYDPLDGSPTLLDVIPLPKVCPVEKGIMFHLSGLYDAEVVEPGISAPGGDKVVAVPGQRMNASRV